MSTTTVSRRAPPWSPWRPRSDARPQALAAQPRPDAVAAIKTVHTLAWASIEACVLYVLHAGFAGRTDKRVGIAPVQVQALTYERHTVRLVREFYQARELILQPRTLDGRHCFVSLSNKNVISVVDYTTAREVRQVPAGRFPQRERLGRAPQDVLDSLSPAAG